MSDEERRAVSLALGQLRHLYKAGGGGLTPHDDGLVRSAIRSLESITSGNPPANRKCEYCRQECGGACGY